MATLLNVTPIPIKRPEKLTRRTGESDIAFMVRSLKHHKGAIILYYDARTKTFYSETRHLYVKKGACDYSQLNLDRKDLQIHQHTITCKRLQRQKIIPQRELADVCCNIGVMEGDRYADRGFGMTDIIVDGTNRTCSNELYKAMLGTITDVLIDGDKQAVHMFLILTDYTNDAEADFTQWMLRKGLKKLIRLLGLHDIQILP